MMAYGIIHCLEQVISTKLIGKGEIAPDDVKALAIVSPMKFSSVQNSNKSLTSMARNKSKVKKQVTMMDVAHIYQPSTDNTFTSSSTVANAFSKKYIQIDR